MPSYACFECGTDVIFPYGAIVIDVVLCETCTETEALISA